MKNITLEGARFTFFFHLTECVVDLNRIWYDVSYLLSTVAKKEERTETIASRLVLYPFYIDI